MALMEIALMFLAFALIWIAHKRGIYFLILRLCVFSIAMLICLALFLSFSSDNVWRFSTWLAFILITMAGITHIVLNEKNNPN